MKIDRSKRASLSSVLVAELRRYDDSKRQM